MSEIRFRMDSKHGRLAWICTPLFAAFGSLSVWLSLTDPSFKEPVFAAWLFGSFWGAWILVGIYQLLAYYRYTLVITDNQIKQAGAFTGSSVDLTELVRVQWKPAPVDGSVVLQTVDETMKITFGNLNRTDRLNAVQILRDQIPGTIQHGWSSFTASPYTDHRST